MAHERRDVPLGREVIGDADERSDRERHQQSTQADERAGLGQEPCQPPAAKQPGKGEQREDRRQKINCRDGDRELLRDSGRKIRDKQAQTKGAEHLWGDLETEPRVCREPRSDRGQTTRSATADQTTRNQRN